MKKLILKNFIKKEKINFEEFYKKSEGDNFKELFAYNQLTFETYCSKLFHRQTLMNDFNNDKNLIEKTLKLIIDDFEEFTMYYSRTNNKKDQIETWKNILYNMRLLFQYKLLTMSDNCLIIL